MAGNDESVCVWRPLDIFDSSADQLHSLDADSTGLIILNQEINEKNENCFKILWSKSAVRLCADGAANRLFEWASKRVNTTNLYVPDYICGDLDSIKDDVRAYYEGQGSICVKLANQDYTDFTKTVQFTINSIRDGCFVNAAYDESDNRTLADVKSKCKQVCSMKNLYCFCNFTGRFDHIMANLHTLLLANNFGDLKMYIVGEESLTCCLQSGDNRIYVNKKRFCGKYCGLFPIVQPTLVTTTGLKWNLDNQLMSFNGLISSSNECLLTNNDEYVFVRTQCPIIWNMTLKCES